MKIIESVRDAMQGVQEFIPTQRKIEYINLLLEVGFDMIDFGSFVSSRQIPQLADTEKVLSGLNTTETDTRLLVLVGSKNGGDKAASFAEIDSIAYPFSVSETFLKYNLNADFNESIGTIEYVQNLCVKTGKDLNLYLAMAFGNPYGDDWNADIVSDWLEKFVKMGIKQISFSDPAAVAEPETIVLLFSQFQREYQNIELGIHIHSEPHNWREKVDAAYQNGCRRFDAVINGFGGCPMSHRKLVSNLKTGDLLRFLEQIGQPYKRLNPEAYQEAMQKADEVFGR